MKSLTSLLLLFAADLGLAQPARFPTITNYPEWQVTVKVTGEDGQPVAGADVDVGSETNFIQFSIKGLTDTDGVLRARAHGAAVVGCVTEKTGYYRTIGPSKQFNGPVDGKWQPWNPTLEVTLKRMVNPIPMYARKALIEIPQVGRAIGFDLIDFDWIAPYGKGKQGDFVFNAHRAWNSRKDFDSKLEVTFPNPGDGVIASPMSLSQGSKRRLSATAPSEGYISKHARHLSNGPGKGWSDDENKEQNYLFRIRTIRNENGEITSALYGKIHGDFVIDPFNSKTMYIQFTYYLNPTPNDRNVEFDPKQNLFRSLKFTEQVRDP